MSVNVHGTNGITFNDNTTQATSPFAGGLGFRNRIINGAMVIDQRNSGAVQTALTGSGSGQYTVDRWRYQATQTGKFNGQQNANAVTPPSTFTNYYGLTSTSAYSVLATDYFLFSQNIEGFNCADLGWGTANTATITLQFWARSSLTGTFGGAVYNSTGNRCYGFTYTMSTANTWTYVTVTIPGDTTGTWLTNNGIGLSVVFGLGAGANFSGAAGAWSSSTIVQPTGTVSVVGTSGATFYITGVQLEKGSTATSFDYRPYGTELALCQRYYEIRQPTSTGYSMIIAQYNLTNFYGNWDFKVTKRATPTLGGFSPLTGQAGIDACTGYFTSANVSSSTLTASAEL